MQNFCKYQHNSLGITLINCSNCKTFDFRIDVNEDVGKGLRFLTLRLLMSYVYVCMYVCMYVYVCVCVYIYIYI